MTNDTRRRDSVDHTLIWPREHAEHRPRPAPRRSAGRVRALAPPPPVWHGIGERPLDIVTRAGRGTVYRRRRTRPLITLLCIGGAIALLMASIGFVLALALTHRLGL